MLSIPGIPLWKGLLLRGTPRIPDHQPKPTMNHLLIGAASFKRATLKFEGFVQDSWHDSLLRSRFSSLYLSHTISPSDRLIDMPQPLCPFFCRFFISNCPPQTRKSKLQQQKQKHLLVAVSSKRNMSPFCGGRGAFCRGVQSPLWDGSSGGDFWWSATRDSTQKDHGHCN